ncbi:MAG: hypothetical protein A2X59_00555 [Nitrospirae bacterium GWC2_42_7]|nr:MAG: hypothetical protein A2X59_00555 [Nitrospirae bacterium GWC2_42_7]
MKEQVTGFISDMVIGISNCSLYSKEHPAVIHVSQSAVSRLDNLYIDDKFSIVTIGRSLTINDEPFADKNIHVRSFIKKLKKNGMDKVVISRGVTQDEIKAFITEIASPEKNVGKHPHITSGVVEVKLGVPASDIGAAFEENREKVKEAYQGVSRFKKLDMVGLEDVVMSFILTIKQEYNFLEVIKPVKSYSEYIYAHNVNVAVLAIFQAESLGLKNDVLHDVGMAGLLHDVGKMFTSKELLEKGTKLDSREWEEMKKHPFYGAKYLASLPDIPRSALIAAYEHHMKFDGSGYPETKRKSRKQHIISQIIAVADYFDALRTDKPYRKSFDITTILKMMKESAGRDLNPFLVENFSAAVDKALLGR